MNERELIDEILYRIEADQHGMIDWIDPVGRARLAAPLEAANKENTALREAVRVLAVSLLDAKSGLAYLGSTHSDLYGVGWERIQKKYDAVLANEIARAAIEAAQKEPQ